MLEEQIGEKNRQEIEGQNPNKVDAAVGALIGAIRAQQGNIVGGGQAPAPTISKMAKTKCDPTFLDGLYLNLAHSICEDSKNAYCGHTDISQYYNAIQMAAMAVGSEITMMITMGGGHANLSNLKGAAIGAGRVQPAMSQHEALKEAFEKLLQSESKKEFNTCAQNFAAVAKDFPAVNEAKQSLERINEINKKGKIAWGARGAILLTSVVLPFLTANAMINTMHPSLNPSDCIESLPDNQYFSTEKINANRELYKYMHYEKMGPACSPSFKMGKEVLDFMNLPYQEQQSILEKSEALCSYYSELNEKVVKGMDPHGSLADVKFDPMEKALDFSISENELPAHYHLDFNPESQDTSTLVIERAYSPKNTTYHFANSIDGIKYLRAVDYVAANGKKYSKTPQELKKSAENKDQVAEQIISQFRQYKYYRPFVTSCIQNGSEKSCAETVKQVQQLGAGG